MQALSVRKWAAWGAWGPSPSQAQPSPAQGLPLWPSRACAPLAAAAAAALWPAMGVCRVARCSADGRAGGLGDGPPVPPPPERRCRSVVGGWCLGAARVHQMDEQPPQETETTSTGT